MKHLEGTIWSTPCDGRVIPVNASQNCCYEVIKSSFEAQALCWRWPSFPWQVCLHHKEHGVRVQAFTPYHAISFPIRYDSRMKVSLALLEKSAMELAELIEREQRQSVVLPLAGLTGGDRKMESEVLAILETWLHSPAFTLVSGATKRHKTLEVTR